MNNQNKQSFDLLTAYSNSAFTVTLFLVAFKIAGISTYSWAWATFYLWIPPAIFLGLVLTAGVLLYVGILILMFGSFLHNKVDWIRNHLKI